MNWQAVIRALEETSRGAELSAKASSDPARQIETRIISGLAASLANAFRHGVELSTHE